MQLHCKFHELDPFTEVISVVNGRTVVAYAPPHSQLPAYVTCPATNMSHQIMIMNHEYITVGDNCNIVFPHHIFRSNSQLNISGNFVSRKMVEISGFKPSKTYELPPTIQPFSRSHFRSSLDSISPASLQSAPWAWFQIFISGLLTVGLFVLAAGLFRRRQRRGRGRRRASHVADAADNEEDIESIPPSHPDPESSNLDRGSHSPRWKWFPCHRGPRKMEERADGDGPRKEPLFLQPTPAPSLEEIE